MTMRSFADHVIAVSNDVTGGITNLQLQKVMYFVLGEYIRDNGIDELVVEIYDEPFEAWPYGPVVRSEYFRHKAFGRYAIQSKGRYFERYAEFDDYIRRYLNVPVTRLVDESHRHSTWSDNREAILLNNRIEYTLEDLVNDFTS